MKTFLIVAMALLVFEAVGQDTAPPTRFPTAGEGLPVYVTPVQSAADASVWNVTREDTKKTSFTLYYRPIAEHLTDLRRTAGLNLLTPVEARVQAAQDSAEAPGGWLCLQVASAFRPEDVTLDGVTVILFASSGEVIARHRLADHLGSRSFYRSTFYNKIDLPIRASVAYNTRVAVVDNANLRRHEFLLRYNPAGLR